MWSWYGNNRRKNLLNWLPREQNLVEEKDVVRNARTRPRCDERRERRLESKESDDEGEDGTASIPNDGGCPSWIDELR